MRIQNRTRNLGSVALAVAAIPFTLGLAACGDDDSTAAGDNDVEAGGGGGGGSGDELAIEITDPADSAEVGESFDMSFDVGVPLGESDTGLHHIHVYYDGETSEGDYDLVYDDSHTVERALESGEHEIEAVVANADHSLTDASDTVTVTVSEGATGGGGDDGGSQDDGGDSDGGYDY